MIMQKIVPIKLPKSSPGTIHMLFMKELRRNLSKAVADFLEFRLFLISCYCVKGGKWKRSVGMVKKEKLKVQK